MRPVHLRWLTPLVVILLIIGCSSDDSGTDITIKQGDPNDPAFLSIQAEVNGVLDTLVERFFSPLTNPWGFPLDSMTIPADYGPFNPEDTVDYGFEDGWYNLYLGNFATSFNSVAIDSVMFIEDGNPSSWFNIHTTDLLVRRHVNTTYGGDLDDYVEESFYLRGTYGNVEQSSAVVVGEVEWEIDDYATLGSVETHDLYEYSIDINSVAYDRNDGFIYEESDVSNGRIVLNVTVTNEMTQDGETTTVTSDWRFNAAFSSDGSASVEVVSNNTRWTYSENYGS